jgi:uncharacterized membrane-anchored protein YhcB (DUF1043 family)
MKLLNRKGNKMSNKIEKANLEFFSFVRDETLRDFAKAYHMLSKDDKGYQKIYEFLSSSFDKNYHLGYRIFEKALVEWKNSYSPVNQNPPEKKK